MSIKPSFLYRFDESDQIISPFKIILQSTQKELETKNKED